MKIVLGVLRYFGERLIPYALATGVVFALGRLSYPQKVDVATDLASPILNIFAIIVGFIATIVTFLLTARGIQSLEELRTTRAFHLLIDYHWEGVFLGFLAAVVSLALLSTGKKVDHFTFHWLFNAWAWLGAASIFAFARVFLLLKFHLKPPPVQG